jgi:hypothetical protein
MAAPGSSPSRSALLTSPAAPLLLQAGVFAVMAWWSWRKWPDPLIDFGRELYVPWQLTQGKVLYRDIASLFGPLSPYVNALWMRLFGVSLTTIALCNLAILAALVTGIYRLIRVSADRFTATAASLITLLLFGFSQYVSVGNYNFVTPYAHEATHGMALSVGMLLAQHRAIASRRPLFSALAGGCFGLLLLTKPETPVAAACAAAVAWMAAAWIDATRRRDLRLHVPLFIAAATLPPLLFLAYFRQYLGTAGAAWAIATAWTTAFGTTISSNPFYIIGMGLDRPFVNAALMALMFLGFVAFVAAAIAVSWTGPSSGKRSPSTKRLARVVLLVAVIPLVRWLPVVLALPLVAATTLAVVVVLFWRARSDRSQAMRMLPILMWGAFALALLAKLGLNARIYHYGFYLALPATTIVVVLVLWLIPHELERRSLGGGRAFRHIALWALAAGMAPYLVISNGWYRTKTLSVGTGGDRFYVSMAPGQWQGAAVREALDEIERRAARDATVAVLPEGVMLNYLARRASPLRVLTVMPPEVLAFGEEDVLASLEAAPPALVLLVDKDVSEYGYPAFGTDLRYGQRTMTWLKERYRVTRVIGDAPMRASGFGIEIRERK